MKFTSSLIAASTVALAAAAPAQQDTKAPSVFSLVSIRGGSAVHNGRISVYQGGLAIGPKQDASCTVANTNYASFFLSEDGGLFLYTDNPPKQAYVDLSQEGNGRLRFSTGVQPIDAKYKRGPFEIVDDALVFRDGDKDIGFQACGLHGGEGYEVLLQPFDDLAGPSCIPFTALVSDESSAPNKCLYNGA